MTRLQAVLVLALATVAALVISQTLWGAVESVPHFVRSVPAWVWWTAFGVWMATRGGCRRHRSCGSRRPSPVA